MAGCAPMFFWSEAPSRWCLDLLQGEVGCPGRLRVQQTMRVMAAEAYGLAVTLREVSCNQLVVRDVVAGVPLCLASCEHHAGRDKKGCLLGVLFAPERAHLLIDLRNLQTKMRSQLVTCTVDALGEIVEGLPTQKGGVDDVARPGPGCPHWAV